MLLIKHTLIDAYQSRDDLMAGNKLLFISLTYVFNIHCACILYVFREVQLDFDSSFCFFILVNYMNELNKSKDNSCKLIAILILLFNVRER